MKRKTILRGTLCAAVLLAAVALMTGVSLARSGGSAAGNHSLNVTMNQPDATMLSGGHYQLTDGTLRGTQGNAGQENDLASGGGYHLKGLAIGSGCCCLYLPCVLH